MSERAKQFMPFAALKGYYDLINQKHCTKEPERILTECEEERLSRILGQLKNGVYTKVTFYNDGAYTTAEGVVEWVDFSAKMLEVSDKIICFEKIINLEGEQGFDDDL